MTNAPGRYFGKVGITSPSYRVYRVAGRAIRDRAAKYFRGRLLDVGCGTKSKELLVGDLVDEYVGLDHEQSPHGLNNVDLIGTAYEIPEPDAAYDCILCTAVLEHLEEPQRALCESYRVLKPGGHALYTVPLFWQVHEEPRDFFRFTEYGCRHLFETAGFEVLEVVPMSGYWLTTATSSAYHLSTVLRGPASWLARVAIAAIHMVAPALEAFDRRFNSSSIRWTWMYLVVGRKPGS